MNRHPHIEGCPRRRFFRPGSCPDHLRHELGGGGGTSNNDPVSKQITATTSGSSSPTTGDSSPVNQGSEQINASGSVTLNQTTDPAAFSTIQNIIATALATTNQTQQAIQQGNNQNNDAVNSIVDKVLAASQAQSANTSSGGQTNNNQTLLWGIGLAILGFLGFGYLTRKKS